MSTRRRRSPLAAAALVAVVAWPHAVSAHGGGAVFDEVVVDQSSPGQVVLSVDITYEDDGEAAEAAIVDVVARRPAGQEADGVRLERAGDPGSYRGDLDLDGPGTWTLEISSSFPPGETEVPVEVGGEVADGRAEVVAEAATTTTEADGGLVDRETGGAEGGFDPTNLIAAVSGVVGGGLGLWVSKRRRARTQATRHEGPAGG